MTILVLLALLPGVAAFGESENARTTGDAQTDAAMVALQKKSKGAQTCLARVTTTVRVEDQEVTIEAQATFKAPNRMKVEKTLPGGAKQTVVSDGSTLWIHDAEDGAVSRISLSRVYKATGIEADTDQFDPIRPFRGVDWGTIRWTGADSTAGGVFQVFTGGPQTNLLFAQLPSPPVRAEIRVSDADGLLREARLFDADSTEVLLQRFSRLRVNAEVPDDTFDFLIPAGSYAVDATEETIEFFQEGAGREEE